MLVWAQKKGARHRKCRAPFFVFLFKGAGCTLTATAPAGGRRARAPHGRAANLRRRAAHCPVKGLAFHRRVCRDVKPFRPLASGPLHSRMKQLFPHALPAQLLRHMKAGKFQIPAAAEQACLHRGKPFQRPFAKGGAHKPAGPTGVFQAAGQRFIIFRRPVIQKRGVLHAPFSIFPAPASGDLLAADKMPEQPRADLLCAQPSIFQSLLPPSATFARYCSTSSMACLPVRCTTSMATMQDVPQLSTS